MRRLRSMIPDGISYCISKVNDDISKKYALIDIYFKELVVHTETIKNNFNGILEIADQSKIDKYINAMDDSIKNMSRIYDEIKTFYRSKEARQLFNSYCKNCDNLRNLIDEIDKASTV